MEVEPDLNRVQRVLAAAADGEQRSTAIRKVANWLNPIVSSPSAPLEVQAFLDSFGPSLMPRTSAMAGAAAGLNILSARAATGVVERVTKSVLPPDAGMGMNLAARAVTGGIGMALARKPQSDGESMYEAGLRTSGQILQLASVGGAIYDLGTGVQRRWPAQRAARPALISALALAGVGYWASRRLAERQEQIQQWPIPQREELPAAVGTAAAVAALGSGIFRGYVGSRNALVRWMGPGVVKNVAARAANAGLWAWGASMLYNAGVGYIGRSNEKVEPAYSTPPGSPLMSGHSESFSPFEDLGLQGRRYVSDAASPALIEDVMQEPGAQQPIRVFVGYNTEPVYPTGRTELALAELERTGAFERSHLLLLAPTGTGWVDHTMIEAAEFFTRGDLATCVIQYGRFPSFLSVQKVALGRSQFRTLLLGVRMRLMGMPPDRRPKVLVFGESLGAWASSDVVMYQGIGGFDHYGIDRALWFGLPGLAKWSRNGMALGSSDLVPEGTVGVFDHPDELEALSAEERKRLRAVILSHDNDPIAQLVPDIAIQRPRWLQGSERGRNVPESMEWAPIATFWKTAIDAANAMVTVPGEFLSFGHDYRADTARFVLRGFDLPDATPEQIERVEAALRSLELERSERIKAPSAEAAPPSPARQDPLMAAGVPLSSTRTAGAARKLAGRRKRA